MMQITLVTTHRNFREADCAKTSGILSYPR